MNVKDERFLCSNAWGCLTDYRAHLAFELIRANGMVAAVMPSPNVATLLPPKEVVARAWDLVDEWTRIAIERGMFGSPISLGVSLQQEKKVQ